LKRDSRRYEIIRMYGFVDGHTLSEAGVEVPENRIHEDILADIWLLDGIVIRALVAPFGKNIADMFHIFMYGDDEDSGLCGVGGPEELRDSQMKRCANDRILMDNMAAIGGPINVLNKAFLLPGQELDDITAFTTIYRDDDNPQTASIPVLTDYKVTSHVSELLAVREAIKKDIDEESCLPGFAMGQPQNLGEAFRTSNNMSMMMGGANSIPKDVVRSFDKFIKSLGTSLLEWNMDPDLNPKKDIKGDYDILPKGTMSLVAKEVRGQALDQFWATIDPAEKAMFDNYGILQDRMAARDLPLDRLKPREQAEQAYQQVMDAQAQAQQIEAGLTQAKTMKTQADAGKSQASAQDIAQSSKAKIMESIARITALIATAKSTEDKQKLEETKLLLEQLTPTEEGGSVNNRTRSTSGNTASKQSGIRKGKKVTSSAA
jgi:hypothetical protein